MERSGARLCLLTVLGTALFSPAHSLCSTPSPKLVFFKENNKINDTIFTITPKHEDVTAAITHQEPEDLCTLRGYNVTANTVMDYETFTDPYTVTIECTKDGFRPSSATVTIVLEDVNDNPPAFAESQFTISVDELTKVDTSVARITATDPDVINDVLYYSLDSPEGEFALLAAFDPDILVKKLLDYDEVQTITMTLYAQDTPISVPAEVSHTATATVIVNVQDIDNRPPWFQPCTENKFGMSKLCLNSGYQGLVNLNEQVTGPLTLKPDQVFAIDGDKGRNEAIEYTFLGGNVNDTFVINVTTGNITMKKPVDVADPIVLSVMAYQQLNVHQHATTSVILRVVITSKHPPRFLKSSYEGFISEDAGVDSLVLESPSSYRALRVQVTDDDFANGFNPNIMLEITNGSDFSITPEGFILMTTDVSPGTVNLQMRVVDTTNEESSTASLTVQVAPGVSTTAAFSTITTDQTSRTAPTGGPTTTRPDNTSPSSTALTPTPTGAPTTTEPEKTSPSSTAFTSTSPQTITEELRPKGIYTAEDMGALGGSLAVVIALCLVCIVLLVCKIRNHKLDWKRLSEASLLQSTLMRGSSGDMKTGLQYSNQDYEDFGSMSSKMAAELEEKLQPEEHHLSTASAPQTIAVDSDAQLDSISSGGSDATDATDREVKPILTKERRAEDGYKAVWFKQDIQKEEDVVIIPDHEDSDEDHQDEDDDDNMEVELRDRFKAQSHGDADTEDTPTTEL